MLQMSLLGSLLTVLLTACLAFGAPAQVKPSTSTPPQAAPAVAAKVQTPSVATDGFLRTNRYFQTCKQSAAEIEATLQKLYTESVADAPDDKVKQQTAFLAKLTKLYPGSTFDGTTGTVPIQTNFVALFNNLRKVYSIKELGNITLDYLVTEGRIQLTEGVNSVTVLVDQTTPAQSKFINVTIPAIKEEAEKILTDPDRKRIAVDTAESAILNDAYQLLSMTNNFRMDIFAASVLNNTSQQALVLQTAANGYRDRHSAEYQGSVDPSKTRKKKPDTTPNKPAESRFYTNFMNAVILFVSAIGIMAAIFFGTRFFQSRPTSKNKAKLQDRYDSLTPMVTKALNRMGISLWGKNWPWSKKYYIYQRRERWLLCDGVEDKDKKIFKARTKIEVRLRSAYFKIRITRLNRVGVDIYLRCDNLSEWDLEKGLKEISLEITNAELDIGKDDVATLETVDQVAVVRKEC